MEIRKASVDDMDLIIDSRIEMIRDLNNLAPNENLDKWFIENTEKYFRRADQATMLAIDNGKAIGCATICYINVLPSFEHPEGKRAHIMNVHVSEKYRCQGIAHKMMNLLIAEAKKNGITEISLDTTELGRPLYEKCGFESTKEGMFLKI
ncbi:MAG: Acetyltransferase family [Clostridiales bacterium]|jgi:ribosomal protein S18 acetylase RimI-like enzyme|nr:Acetyltransferase family [Clostridiales bacterium]